MLNIIDGFLRKIVPFAVKNRFDFRNRMISQPELNNQIFRGSNILWSFSARFFIKKEDIGITTFPFFSEPGN
ncbi:MAG: hypothetical protein RO257_16065 [Candidatus Kapabacteria bacterium]|nr:hypothetical protein [Candidatus Kapabacteria bacterium]MDT3739637.1 hypothetical protein [Candidatus Kapabacteria bacterium]MDT3739884.1 hypothetical protein [Candidatus Kapabacteria bacterium]MDT3739920.1 hypothetical protein [Candidatus Kapabacteria bacterium]MDT3739951.1 hypothetical protein [Candidatus Kapabacteria bacterium]